MFAFVLAEPAVLARASITDDVVLRMLAPQPADCMAGGSLPDNVRFAVDVHQRSFALQKQNEQRSLLSGEGGLSFQRELVLRLALRSAAALDARLIDDE